MHLVVGEQASLGNVFAVQLETENPESWVAAVLVTYRTVKCLAFIDRNVQSAPDAARVLLSPVVRDHLGVQIGSSVEIESVGMISKAARVALSVPAEWIETDMEQWVRNTMVGRPVFVGMEVGVYTLLGKKSAVVTELDPHPYAELDLHTKTSFVPQVAPTEDAADDGATGWDDIGGLGPAKAKIRELVEFPLKFPKALAHLGIEPPRGILLHGPPGTGKTLIAKALADQMRARFVVIQGPEIVSGIVGGSEQNLREKFEEAASNAPSILYIDEIDAIATKREDAHGEMERRLTTQLQVLMNGVKTTKGVMVIGSTNRPNALDPALRRPGRFEYEIYIGIPNPEGRREILEIHTRRRGMPLAQDVNVDAIAGRTHGFVGADLAFLCREAGYSAFKRYFGSAAAAESDFTGLQVTMADFENALSIVSPSALREIMVEVPRGVGWDSIGGLRAVKKAIDENFLRAIKNPIVFKDMGLKPAKGILLYGPPGTGKTLIAKAMANECGANFVAVKGPELRSMWFGKSEENIRRVFETARRVAPCVIFFDEIDALAPARGKGHADLTDSLVNQLLAEMDGAQEADGVYVLGATNRPELIDPALLRPGRFDVRIEVPLPDREGIEAILRINLKPAVLGSDVTLSDLADRIDGLGFSGADVAEVCRLAGLRALELEDFKKAAPITMEDLLLSVENLETQYKEGKRWPGKQIGFLAPR